MRNGRWILSAARTLSVVVMFGLLLLAGWFVRDELNDRDRKIESLQDRLVENYKDISVMTNAYIAIREDNFNLLKNIEFWKRQCEMLIRENHELKGIPDDNKKPVALPTQPAPEPTATNNTAVAKADVKVNPKHPERMYDEKGREYIYKNGKKVIIVRKKVSAKPKNLDEDKK